MSFKSMIAATVVAAGLVSGAQAALVPVTSVPVASGPVKAVFAFVQAQDVSQLDFAQPPLGPLTVLITNNGGSANPLGFTTGPFGGAGPIEFRLVNTSKGYNFVAGVADLVDGVQHARTSTNFFDFGVGNLSNTVRNAIIAAGGSVSGQNIVTTGRFIGFEDRRGTLNQSGVANPVKRGPSDYDFNDLIYWFSSVTTPSVPAPAALALFGMGLLGLGLARRRA